jgi:hypothetical protein
VQLEAKDGKILPARSCEGFLPNTASPEASPGLSGAPPGPQYCTVPGRPGRLQVLAYLGKMPANFVPHFLMIQASSELTRPGTCLVYSWKELPAGFYRLNVTMTRDRIFSLKSALFFARR